jgi:hypothetical protein
MKFEVDDVINGPFLIGDARAFHLFHPFDKFWHDSSTRRELSNELLSAELGQELPKIDFFRLAVDRF